VLNKIEKTLTRWNLCHPSLDGKQLITQMVVGRMTQFLTKAQGMPKSIEITLKKTIWTFMWDNCKHPPISLTCLERPVEEGGLGLLNISAQNKAIEIMQLRTYMDLTTTRPTWVFITNAIINTLNPSGIRDQKDINAFLTSWDLPIRGPRACHLPKSITNILVIACKHNVSFAPLKLSGSLKDQMPAWYHLGAPLKPYHKTKNLCLQILHKVKSVKDLKTMSNRLTRAETHQPKPTCPCNYCLEDRLTGCKNPDKCVHTV
jgi:hypothetical protein